MDKVRVKAVPKSSSRMASAVVTPCLLLLLSSLAAAADGLDAGLELDHYHNYTSVKILFKRLESEYPRLARLHTIGQSVQKRQLYVLQVTDSLIGLLGTRPA